MPDMWFGVNPPVPRCGVCGATACSQFGPVIPMTPQRRTVLCVPGSAGGAQVAVIHGGGSDV